MTFCFEAGFLLTLICFTGVFSPTRTPFAFYLDTRRTTPRRNNESKRCYFSSFYRKQKRATEGFFPLRLRERKAVLFSSSASDMLGGWTQKMRNSHFCDFLCQKKLGNHRPRVTLLPPFGPFFFPLAAQSVSLPKDRDGMYEHGWVPTAVMLPCGQDAAITHDQEMLFDHEARETNFCLLLCLGHSKSYPCSCFRRRLWRESRMSASFAFEISPSWRKCISKELFCCEDERET